MTHRILLDTDVLIDYFRKRPQAIEFVETLQDRPVLSVITIAELFAGVREGSERSDLEAFVRRSVLIDLDEQICVMAGLLLRQYRKSHGMGLADALIAATVESQGAGFATLNARHFPMLSGVFAPYVRSER